MSAATQGSLRVAVLHHGYGSSRRSAIRGVVDDLAGALREVGHRPCVLTSHMGPPGRSLEAGVPVVWSRRRAERVLAARGFAGPLSHLPATARALASGRYDLAHALSAPDALAARLWGRCAGRPVVFGCLDPPRRENLADRRLRLWLTRSAVEDSDAVVAASLDCRAGLKRWFGVEVPVIVPDDAAGHERLYRQLLDREQPRCRRGGES